MSQIVLQTQKLTKHYGDVVAVSEVTIQVREGEVFGFLGPNGAGKTTTIGMILGLIHPTAGQIEVLGEPVSARNNKALQGVGSLVSRPSLLPYLSGRENLRLLARHNSEVDDERVDEVLELVGMTQTAGRKVKACSTGMKQRLGLGAALLNRPPLIILDEPTNGLDPAGMRDVRNLIRSLTDSGATVFLSSHLLNEVEQVCDRIAIINHGKIVAEGSVDELLSHQDYVVKVRVASPGQARRSLETLPGVTQIESNGATLEVRGLPSERIISHLAQQDIFPSEVAVQKSDLESLYLSLTQS
jgi:ABC-2 type transport system ATP-binding protein